MPAFKYIGKKNRARNAVFGAVTYELTDPILDSNLIDSSYVSCAYIRWRTYIVLGFR